MSTMRPYEVTRKVMQTRQLTPSTFKNTRAQLAFSCAQLCYTARHDDIEYSDPLKGTLTDHVVNEFKALLSCVVDSESSKQLGLYTFSDEEQPPDSPLATNQRKYIAGGKLHHFNERNEIVLDKESIDELKAFFDEFELASDAHAHEINEYSGDKVSPVSSRRLAALSSGYAFVGCNFAAMISDTDEMDPLTDDLTCDEIGNDAISIGFKVVFGYFISANFYKYVRQIRTSDFVLESRLCMIQALSKLKKLKGFDVTKEHYDNLNSLANVLLVKGNISAQASKVRRRATLAASVAIAIFFYSSDISTMGFALWARLLFAAGFGAVSGSVRYYSKWRQNQKKLYDKQYRMPITIAFSQRVQSELKVFGLDPVDDTVVLRSSTTDQTRWVEVDVKDFITDYRSEILSRKEACFHGKDNPSVKDCETFLKEAKRFAQQNIPPKYQGCWKYFMLEFSLQVRQEYLGEDAEKINGERQEAFGHYYMQFVARQDAKSISRYNQYMLLDKKSPLTKPKEEKSKQQQRQENFSNLIKEFLRKAQKSALSNHERELFFKNINAVYTEISRSEQDKLEWSKQLACLLIARKNDYLLEDNALAIEELEKLLNKPAEIKHAPEETKRYEIATNYDDVYVAKEDEILQEIQSKFPRITMDHLFGEVPKASEESVKKSMRSSLDFVRYKRHRYDIYPWQEQSEEVNERALNAYYVKNYMQARRRIAQRKTPKALNFNWDLLDREGVELTVCGKDYDFSERAILCEIRKGFPRITKDSIFGKAANLTQESLKITVKNSWRFTYHKYQRCGILPWDQVAEVENDTMLDAYYKTLETKAKKQLIKKQLGSVVNFHKSSDQLFNELLERPGMKVKHDENMTGVLESSMWSGVRKAIIACFPLFVPASAASTGAGAAADKAAKYLEASTGAAVASFAVTCHAIKRARHTKCMQRLSNIPERKEVPGDNKITSTLADYGLFSSTSSVDNQMTHGSSITSLSSAGSGGD